jgi:hypothetical protein
MRPGGRTTTAAIKSKISSTPEIYHLIGDHDSVRAVLVALMDNCTVQDTISTMTTFDRDSSSKAVWPEQVIQYYRGSTFAFSLDGYNNTASLFSNQPKDNNTAPPVLVDTPLPTGLNMTFLACLNVTTGFSVPLIKVNPPKHFSKGVLAGIILGSIFGTIIYLLLFYGISHFFMERGVNRILAKKGPYLQSYGDLPPRPNPWYKPPKPNSWSKFLSLKHIFAFGRKEKVDAQENRGGYSSLRTPGGTFTTPESQNLAVNKEGGPPAFQEMVEEPDSIPLAPLVGHTALAR